jgi:hypothetical protein
MIIAKVIKWYILHKPVQAWAITCFFVCLFASCYMAYLSSLTQYVTIDILAFHIFLGFTLAGFIFMLPFVSLFVVYLLVECAKGIYNHFKTTVKQYRKEMNK